MLASQELGGTPLLEILLPFPNFQQNRAVIASTDPSGAPLLYSPYWSLHGACKWQPWAVFGTKKVF